MKLTSEMIVEGGKRSMIVDSLAWTGSTGTLLGMVSIKCLQYAFQKNQESLGKEVNHVSHGFNNVFQVIVRLNFFCFELWELNI